MAKDEVSAGGMRYRDKTNGTSFQEGALLGTKMSCFVCGKHEDRGLGGWRRILGQKRFCCREHTTQNRSAP